MVHSKPAAVGDEDQRRMESRALLVVSKKMVLKRLNNKAMIGLIGIVFETAASVWLETPPNARESLSAPLFTGIHYFFGWGVRQQGGRGATDSGGASGGKALRFPGAGGGGGCPRMGLPPGSSFFFFFFFF